MMGMFSPDENGWYTQEEYRQLKAENEKLRFPREDIDFAVLTKEEFENYNKLKVENEELKENLAINKDAFNSICVEKYKLENCLDEIEERLKAVSYLEPQTTRILKMDIENIINQAKEDK